MYLFTEQSYHEMDPTSVAAQHMFVVTNGCNVKALDPHDRNLQFVKLYLETCGIPLLMLLLLA